MAEPWKMPPLVKVYEAIGALGDRRVILKDETRAAVVSSEGDKTYEVENSPDLHEVSSNDNASYWQGYLGYPGIAVLLARGLYRPRPQTVEALGAIPWKALNRRFRNDYAKTIAEVTRLIEERGYDAESVKAEVQAVMDALRKLAPVRGKRKRPPAEKPARRRVS
jgi:hypothetical protein